MAKEMPPKASKSERQEKEEVLTKEDFLKALKKGYAASFNQESD